jgi:3-isopropylmalate dehydrogenase
MKEFTIAVLTGDGIGPEVVEQAVRVLKAATQLSRNVEIKLKFLPAGLEAYEQYGTTFPDVTRQGLDQSDGCLLGPVSTHLYTAPGMFNLSGFLRKTKSLYANIRDMR